MTAPGYAYDIGGGVAYACPTCKAQTPRPEECDGGEVCPEPGDFWPLDPARLNGTERCEGCGCSLGRVPE
jgi:hypothetical protein